MGYEKGRVKKFKKSEESKVRAGARREERRESAKGGGMAWHTPYIGVDSIHATTTTTPQKKKKKKTGVSAAFWWRRGLILVDGKDYILGRVVSGTEEGRDGLVVCFRGVCFSGEGCVRLGE